MSRAAVVSAEAQLAAARSRVEQSRAALGTARAASISTGRMPWPSRPTSRGPTRTSRATASSPGPAAPPVSSSTMPSDGPFGNGQAGVGPARKISASEAQVTGRGGGQDGPGGSQPGRCSARSGQGRSRPGRGAARPGQHGQGSRRLQLLQRDAAEGDTQQLEAQRAPAELQLSYTRIVAPRPASDQEDGRARHLREVGSRSWRSCRRRRGGRQLQGDPDHRMRPGQPVSIKVDAYPDAEFHGASRAPAWHRGALQPPAAGETPPGTT